jgi:hypothetical protein
MVVRRAAGLAVAAVLVAGIAGACSDDSTPAKKKAATPEPTTTTAPPPPNAPLTGVPDPTGLSITRPALEVKIENAPEARPQAGLEAADVVYEEVVEGGITRFLVIFNSTVPEPIGPIRSVRDMDPYIVWPLGGVFAFSGGAPGPVAAIREAPVNIQDETAAGDAMFRDSGRAAPHDLFGHTQMLFDRGGAPVPPLPLFTYLGPGEAFVGEPVVQTRLGFSAGYDPTYSYDAATGLWNRSYGLEPFVAASGEQIAPANVVVQFIEYPAYSQGNTVGEGDAWVFAGGQLVRGRWIRPTRDAPAQYVDAAGVPIKLVPGRTWVELLPIGATVDAVAPPPPPPTSAPAPTTTTRKKPNNK